MSVKTTSKPAPVVDPGPQATPAVADAPAVGFLPSTDLGDQLRHLHQEQTAIDRRRAEELARLREIQNRD